MKRIPYGSVLQGYLKKRLFDKAAEQLVLISGHVETTPRRTSQSFDALSMDGSVTQLYSLGTLFPVFSPVVFLLPLCFLLLQPSD